MSLKVNGQTYGWGDVDVKIPGLVLVVQEISYDDEQEMEESYGKGYRPRGYGKGNYKASGKMSMLRDDYDDVLAYCKAKGIGAYQGGTCNETDRSAQVCVHCALATQPVQILAKPGMGVDEGYMIVSNEMNRILALRQAKQRS